jgi:uncharacterized protein YjiS (DUF1127 family)
MLKQHSWNATIRPRRRDGPMVAAGIGRVLGLTATWRRRARDRYALLAMSERDLRDIGVTRFDAVREAEKPFWRV